MNRPTGDSIGRILKGDIRDYMHRFLVRDGYSMSRGQHFRYCRVVRVVVQ